MGSQFHHWLRWVAVVVLHETNTRKCKCYKLGLLISLFTMTFQRQRNWRECEDRGFMRFLVFPSVTRWLDENLPTRGKEGDTGRSRVPQPSGGLRGFCSETTHSRMLPRNCPNLASSSQKKSIKTPRATKVNGEKKRK